MGGQKHSVDEMNKQRAAAAASGNAGYAYSAQVKKGKATNIHPMNNPALGGKRYSMLPPFNPAEKTKNLVSVGFILDVTGSNEETAISTHKNMPLLFDLLGTQKWIGSNAILNLQFGAIGDIRGDRFPLQLGQFEQAGQVLDEYTQRLVLENGGGGNKHESYDMALWAACYQNDLEQWKSGGKGHLFVVFDEMLYDHVRVSELKRVYHAQANARDLMPDDKIELSVTQLRDSLDAGADSVVLPDNDIPIEDMVAHLLTKYDVHPIICRGSSYYRSTGLPDPEVIGQWESLFGRESVVRLDDPADVVWTVAGIMARSNGFKTDAIMDKLIDLGARGSQSIALALNSIIPINSGIIMNSFQSSTHSVKLNKNGGIVKL